MIENLISKINNYDTIIIHRHNRPDLDALGSQVGLANAIKDNFPTKKVFIVGDMTEKYSFLSKMDEISDDLYVDALVIIVDVAVSTMVSDDRYKLAKDVFILDHHTNKSDITENYYIDPSYSAAAELIADFLITNNYKISEITATALFGGIVTDSGRFQYSSTTPRTFNIAAKLLECGANMSYIYDNIYVENLASRVMKNYFSNNFNTTDNGVAYLINKDEDLAKFPEADVFSISRGMVGVMAGINEIPIWCNFTIDHSREVILGEFRSRNIKIVDIAKKYGGGGHDLACGASLDSWETVDKVIADFDLLAKENK